MSAPVAIITGAGKGIGRATATLLAGKGYRLALVSRTREDLLATQKLAPGSAIFPVDVTDADAVERVVRQSLDAFGQIDAVLNNAGAAPVLSVSQTTPAEWKRVIDTNLSSAMYLSHFVWNHFVARKQGVIVNVSSVASREPFPGFAAYASAKAGLNMLTTVLAREGAEHGIRAHSVAPGATETGMFRSIMDEKQFPRDQTLEPADVANIIADCVTGELRYTSGEVIWLRKQVS